MPEEPEEETYSLIFTSLKHPIRRRILRMLAERPLTFSGILESLSIDSGHLSYHLESLGDLVTRSEEGKYDLSSIGLAAVKLMSGVEDNPGVSIPHKSRVRQVIAEVYLLILVGGIILASLYFVNFTISEFSGSAGYGGEVVSIQPNQTFRLNVTIVFKRGNSFGILGRNGSFTVDTYPLAKTLTYWDNGVLSLPVKPGEYSEMGITIYGPDGTIDPYGVTRLANGLTVTYQAEVTQEGTYSLWIKNVGLEDIHPSVGWEITWYHFDKPYFYYGVVGLILALFYPVLVLIRLLKLI